MDEIYSNESMFPLFNALREHEMDTNNHNTS